MPAVQPLHKLQAPPLRQLALPHPHCPGGAVRAGSRDYLKNMLTGACQGDVGLLMFPADDTFQASIQAGSPKGDHKDTKVIMGQTYHHLCLMRELGVGQLICCVNKMDCEAAGYSFMHFDDIRYAIEKMLTDLNYNPELVPIIPISGLMGDNLTTKSPNMPWWEGRVAYTKDRRNVKVVTLLDALDNFVCAPSRYAATPLRLPLSAVYKVPNVGDVVTGRVQGVVRPGDEVVFLPRHTAATPCEGKVLSVEMYDKVLEQGGPGDIVDLNIEGLDKARLPQNGDVMVLKSDTTLQPVKSFTAHVAALDIVGRTELRVGYTPVAYVQCGHAACKITRIVFKGEGKNKEADPKGFHAGEVAEVVFEPCKPLVVEPQVGGLAHLAFVDGSDTVMHGIVVSVTPK
jgi:elongation factor 1-alpha